MYVFLSLFKKPIKWMGGAGPYNVSVVGPKFINGLLGLSQPESFSRRFVKNP